MDFEKRLKIRLICSAVYILLGAAMWVCTLCGVPMNNVLSSFQTVLIVIGAVNIVRTVRIKNNPDLYERVKTVESDERSNMIYIKASRLTLVTAIYISCAAVIVLSCFDKTAAAQTVAFCMCGICVLHYIYVVILRKIY